MLLEAKPDAPARLDVGWMPEAAAAPRRHIGSGFWVAGGLCTLVAGWLALSVVSFVLALFRQSGALGGLSAARIRMGWVAPAWAFYTPTDSVVQAVRTYVAVRSL